MARYSVNPVTLLFVAVAFAFTVPFLAEMFRLLFEGLQQQGILSYRVREPYLQPTYDFTTALLVQLLRILSDPQSLIIIVASTIILLAFYVRWWR